MPLTYQRWPRDCLYLPCHMPVPVLGSPLNYATTYRATTDQVRLVVDSGLRRASAYDPAVGMAALVTLPSYHPIQPPACPL